MRMPSSSISLALVRVSMFSAAFAMLVCGWPGPLYARLNWPSIAETFTTYLRRAAAAAIDGRSRETRMNGATELHSCTSRSSIGSTSSTVCTQLLVCARSGSRPPASIAMPRSMRSGDAEPATSASELTSAADRFAAEASVRRRQRSGQGRRVSVAGLAEGHDVGQFTRRQCAGLGLGERAVGAGGAADRLRGVVDQDVERTLCGNGIGERHHLGGIAQVDADDPQTGGSSRRCPPSP